jgi:hypothetical protein
MIYKKEEYHQEENIIHNILYNNSSQSTHKNLPTENQSNS